MKPGHLVLVTGPAAAGKSTFAKALQAAFVAKAELCLAVELDVFGRSLPREWVAMESRTGRYASRGFTYARGEDGSVALTLGSDGRRVLSAFHVSVAAIVRSGVNVVCETIVYNDDDWKHWCDALGGIPARWVKLNAPLAVLENRERADRTRVFQGLARGMSARPSVGTYDIEADTSRESAREIVDRVMALLGEAKAVTGTRHV